MTFSFDMVVYLLGLAVTAGSIITKINTLEKKVEKHNNVIERVFKLEESTKSAHHRIDELREAYNDN